MQATGSKIFVQAEELKTTSGIIAPQMAKQGFRIYKVVCVGPGDPNPMTGNYMPMPCKVGDRIVADALMAPEITIIKNDVRTKYNIIAPKDVQLVLDDDETAA